MRSLFFFILIFISIGVAAAEIKLPPLHHPVGGKLAQGMEPPEAFVLGRQSELICDTCHGVSDLEKIPLEEVDSSVEDFLLQGPYDSLTTFCYRCHEKQGMERFNVHLMFDQGGRLDEQRCLYCHQESPEPEQVTDRSQLKFRQPLENLCLGCHLKTPHLNTLAHQVEPSEEIREAMKKAEEKHQIILPLDSRKRVTCVTCHTPHEQGVIDSDRAGGKQVADHPVNEGIGYRDDPWGGVYLEDKKVRLAELQQTLDKTIELPAYRRIEKEILLRLPARDGSLCQACHQFQE
ncbi:MAG: hypothetical protein JMN25_03310 [gamma proteobacterium endosymbiont of Lamellibrachia anaximandri]|nr:hypothetical protein [gamma proteobacterium endosymbiont of Lamellibrachia anaximandri]